MQSLPIRILLVEDNPGDMRLIRHMLHSTPVLGIDLTSTERLDSALQRLATHAFDLVLLDLSLPDSQGLTTFETLYQQSPELPIIVLTGLDDEEFAVNAVRSGAQDYLVKSEINSQLLLRAIRYAIERKRSAEALRETQLRYTALFENSNNGIFLISLEGLYLNLNQKAATMLGCTVTDSLGEPATDFIFAAAIGDLHQQIATLLRGETLPIYECLLQCRTGGQLPLEVNTTLVRTAANKPLYIQSVARDITKRRQIEDALRAERSQLAQRVAERTQELSAVNAKLLRSARMKDEFLATVSHELRTPLSVILTITEAMEDHVYGELSAPQAKALQRMRKSGRHLLALINDILDVSKIESGKLALEIGPLSLQTICEDSLQMVHEAAAAKGLALLTTLDPTVALCYADGRRLMQMLVNLLNNAIKFTPTGGKVGLDVHSDRIHGALFFTVWDTGIGIAETDMPRLFQPFVQLDSRLAREYQGAGLGLALVYRLAELHGGSITVESVINQGSRFTISLPWHPTGAREVLQNQAEMALPNKQTAHVANGSQQPLLLLVEDNAISLEAMDAYLRAMGYRLILAHTGAESIVQAKEHQPDLILMDIQMPEMDGLEAIQQIRRCPSLLHTPIIALTALAMPGDRDRCLAAGATAYLSKPVSLQHLKQVIQLQIAEHHTTE